MNPLLCIPSPRDIPRFLARMDTITKYDKLWVKYFFPEIVAYHNIRREFLQHKEYTHLVIIPDDLLITQEKLDLLLDDFNHITGSEDTVISGYCNVDTTRFKDCSNVCLSQVSVNRSQRIYSWITLQDFQDWRKEADYNKPLENLMYVGFAGFTCMVIPRKIIEHREFRNDSASGHDSDGCCVDTMFCSHILEENYKILVDIRCDFHHMKIADNNYEYFYANVRKPFIKWEMKKGS